MCEGGNFLGELFFMQTTLIDKWGTINVVMNKKYWLYSHCVQCSPNGFSVFTLAFHGHATALISMWKRIRKLLWSPAQALWSLTSAERRPRRTRACISASPATSMALPCPITSSSVSQVRQALIKLTQECFLKIFFSQLLFNWASNSVS